MPRVKREKLQVVAEGHQRFWVNNGPVLAGVGELKTALLAMSDEQFAHHVTAEKNDFAKWVEEVLGDGQSAQALKRAKTRKAAARSIKV